MSENITGDSGFYPELNAKRIKLISSLRSAKCVRKLERSLVRKDLAARLSAMFVREG